MKFQRVFVVLILMGLWPGFSSGDIVSTRIMDFRDDAEEDITGPTAGDVRRSSADLEIGNENLVEQWVGLRFQNISIPTGSVVNSASILFMATTTDVGTLNIPISGELTPDPVSFGDTTPLTGRPLTAATVAWDIDPWFPGDAGPNTTTPDLTSIVQEIVGQTGWSSGNSMAFIFKNDPMDTSERIAVAFDDNPDQAALLVIDFTPVSVPEPGGMMVLLGIGLAIGCRRFRKHPHLVF